MHTSDRERPARGALAGSLSCAPFRLVAGSALWRRAGQDGHSWDAEKSLSSRNPKRDLAFLPSLHRPQAAVKFVQASTPPSLRGTMWSI